VVTSISEPIPGSARSIAAGFSPQQRNIAVIVVALAFAMDLMDSTILNIALPTIQNHMHASNTSVHWMASAYTLTFALLLVAGGRLGDITGYRKLFMIGVAGFMISSLIVGLAWNPDALIVARFVQGGAAALMVPQVLSVVQLLYKPEEQVAVNGMLGGITVMATTLAPIITGLLIKGDVFGLSWRPIFFINVPVCLAALALARKYLPGGKSDKKLSLDGVGTLLAIMAVLLLVYPTIEGQSNGWPAWTYIMMALAVPVLAVFFWWQRRQARTNGSPLVEPSLFKSRSFSVGLLINLLFYAAVLCFALTFSMLLQLGHGFSAIHTVLTSLFITAGVMFCVAVLLKKAIPALGRYSLTIGAILSVLSTAGVAIVANHAGSGLNTWELAPVLFVMGLGMGFLAAALLPFILSQVNPMDAGSASGTANAVQQVGGAVGVALISEAFFNKLASSGNYNQAFSDGAWLQVALLVVCAVLTFYMPRRISMPDMGGAAGDPGAAGAMAGVDGAAAAVPGMTVSESATAPSPVVPTD
jgi:EmrB/QacA subfamily drug resistance transporter